MRSDGTASVVCWCIRALGSSLCLSSCLPSPHPSVLSVCACSLLPAAQAGWVYQEQGKAPQGSVCIPAGAGVVPTCHGYRARMESEDHCRKMEFYFPSLLNTEDLQ